MALIENDVIVTTKHGRMPAFAACPDAPGALGHGYLFAERMSHAPVAAEETWGEMFDLWDRNLK